MTKLLSSVQFRLVGLTLLCMTPAVALMLYADLAWLGVVVALAGLAGLWYGFEVFVDPQIQLLLHTTRELSRGNLTSRTGMSRERGELGEIARQMDSMAASLEKQIRDSATAEKLMLNRAHQQTVVAALGQFALVSTDTSALFNHAAMLATQTLEVEYCSILEHLPEDGHLVLRSGVGWKDGCVGNAIVGVGTNTETGYTLATGEPIVTDFTKENRFRQSPLFAEHGVVSGAYVVISGHNRPFGVLGLQTAKRRSFSGDEAQFLISIATVLAMGLERQRTEPEIQKLAAFAQFNPNPVLEFTSHGTLSYYNEAARKMAESLDQDQAASVLPVETERIVQTCLATGEDLLQLETRPGNRILSWSFYPVLLSNVVHCYVEDITDRVALEDQMRHLQKMESVGQLAAGVAHDFNNILTIIQGHSGLLMASSYLTPAMSSSIQAVSFAAERATSLTRQLLMFSRKQVMQPRPLDITETVSNMSKMLQRLLGETIELSFHSTPDLPLVEGDTGMIEQILMNLAVNARDAMVKGGELTIITDVMDIPEAYLKRSPEARVGRFICLVVADNGIGMDAATMKRIFEPFFTTKAEGKGTGLGLATVYGIVKQHQGWIEVASQPNRGTTFKIYLPISAQLSIKTEESKLAGPTPVKGGNETILVVEDEPVLLELANNILNDCGYNVVGASSGIDALTIWQRQNGNIDLLLTDMIMPEGLSGKELADTLRAHKPSLKILFSSGYNVEDMGNDFNPDNRFQFLQKPYSRSTLARAVRECLDNQGG